MEVAAGEHGAVVRRAGRWVWKNERIIGSGAGFDLEDRRDVGERTANGAVDLRHAAQAVGVLHAGAVFAVGFANLGVPKQRDKVRGGSELAGMRTGALNALVESGGRAHERIERHCAGDVSQADEAASARHGKRADSDHGLGAIEQRQAFLGGKRKRLEAGALQGFSAGDTLAVVEGFAFADDDESEMGERSKIAAGAHGAFLRDDGMDLGIEQANEQLGELDARTAESLGEHVGAKHQHGARFGLAERLAHAAGMAADQIGLELGEMVAGDADVSQLAKAGVDAVDGLPRGNDALDEGAARGHALARGVSDGDGATIERNTFDFGKSKGLAIELERFHKVDASGEA